MSTNSIQLCYDDGPEQQLPPPLILQMYKVNEVTSEIKFNFDESLKNDINYFRMKIQIPSVSAEYIDSDLVVSGNDRSFLMVNGTGFPLWSIAFRLKLYAIGKNGRAGESAAIITNKK